MLESSYIGIIHNVALLLAIIIVFNSTTLRWKTRQLSWRQGFIGIILGLIAVAVMLTPWVYVPGIVFDTRSILLCITGLYFGFIPTIIAMVMTIALRYTQGGAGVWMGIGVIISSCAIGLIWRHFRRKSLASISWWEMFLFGVVVHIAMLIMVLLLPPDKIVKTFMQIYIPVLTIYPLGTASLGMMLSKRLRDETLSDQIKENEIKFRIVADNTYDWEYWIDNAGNFAYCSPSCHRITGHIANEFYKKPSLLTSIINPEDMTIYTKHHENGDSGKELEYRIIMPDGTIRWVNQVYTTVWGDNNECLGIRASIRDITEKKKMEHDRNKFNQQIQQSQKMESLGVLAGGIAHDFNNILMAVLGYADLSLLSLSNVSPVRDNIKQIIIASHRAAELCQQMLAYSGKASFSSMNINLGELVNEMTHLLKTTISKKAILNLHVEQQIPFIQADPSQIRQIVMNLIINASDAIGDRSGVISIAVGATRCDEYYLKNTELCDDLTPGLYAHIEVADTGCGMDAETQARIFEPFFTTKFLGRGLGLSAVIGIIRANKGAIKVYSEVGKGTTFKLLFPAINEPAMLSGEVKGNEKSEWKGKGNILLADDEESIRAVGATMLEYLGYSVTTVNDGREAINIYEQKYNEFDFVILDMTMPHVDGAEAFKEIRRINPNAKVLLSSGYSKEDIGARFAGKGVTGVLQKPYTVTVLKDALMDVDA